VLAVEPGGDDGGDEELGAVGVGSCVGHGEETGLGVAEGEVLISKLAAVDGLTASAVAAGEVTTLEHELGDHTVESAALVAEGLATATDTLLTSAEAAEVLGGLGDNVREEGEDDAAGRGTTDRDIKEHTRTLCHLGLLYTQKKKEREVCKMGKKNKDNNNN